MAYTEVPVTCFTSEIQKLLAKIYQIWYNIKDIISERGLTQFETAKILEIDQPKVSVLKNGMLGAFQ